MSTLLQLVAGCCLLGAALGCGAVKRVHECQGVIETVNVAVAGLYVEVPDAGVSPSAYTAIAEAYEQLNTRLVELDPQDSSLAKAVEGYREVTERAAKNARSYSEALAAPARTKRERTDKDANLSKLRARAQNDVTREAQAVRKLNSVCHPQ